MQLILNSIFKIRIDAKGRVAQATRCSLCGVFRKIQGQAERSPILLQRNQGQSRLSPHFYYAMIYHERKSVVRILAIAHGHRQPG